MKPRAGTEPALSTDAVTPSVAHSAPSQSIKEARSAVMLQANLLLEQGRRHDQVIFFNAIQDALDQLIAAVRADALARLEALERELREDHLERVQLGAHAQQVFTEQAEQIKDLQIRLMASARREEPTS